MADLRFVERSPLALHAVGASVGPKDGAPGVTLAEVIGQNLTLLIARKGQGDTVARLATPSGPPLPRTPTFVTSDDCHIVWAGPDQWLVVSDAARKAQADRIIASCAPACMVVDQSDARALIAVGGPKARETLAKGFGIDLHPRAFKPGNVALTIAAGLNVQIWQTDATPRYMIATARSSAETFWHWLTDSAAEFGFSVDARAGAA